LTQFIEHTLRTNNEAARLNLLRDQNYKKYCSEGTMQKEHIKGRVKLALKYLYNIDNE
jgi:hypothetical protein